MTMVDLENITVEFPIYGLSTRSFRTQLVRISTGGLIKRDDARIVMVKALNNLSLNICEGERVGLIGHNGAGKSTLLRLIAGIYETTMGTATIQGVVTSLLDVMVGMDEESTGNENIILRGILHGLTRKEIKKKQEDIAAFTELGAYLQMPIRTYSTGMRLRLAFGIATSVQPEILVLDEVVGAGDAAFLAKAKHRLLSVIEQAKIVFLASHDNKIIREICNKVLWLEAGQLKFYGDVEEGLALYESQSRV